MACAETRSEIATSFRDGQMVQQSYEAAKAKYRVLDSTAAAPLFQRTLPPDPQYDDTEIYLG